MSEECYCARDVGISGGHEDNCLTILALKSELAQAKERAEEQDSEIIKLEFKIEGLQDDICAERTAFVGLEEINKRLESELADLEKREERAAGLLSTVKECSDDSTDRHICHGCKNKIQAFLDERGKP